MNIKDKILVLETYKSNPNIDLRDLHKLIDDKISWENLLAVFTELGKERLINRVNTTGEITKLGKNRLNEFKSEYKNERNEIKKSEIDLKLRTWQLKTFWWIFGIAFVGFVLSTYNFTKDLIPSRNINVLEEQIDKMEAEISGLQSLILNKKSIDSLNSTQDSSKIVDLSKK